MDNDTATQVISLLKKHGRKHPRLESDENLSIRKDLGLDGEEALDFMNEFTVLFAVDMKGFDFMTWFGNEGVPNPFGFLKTIVRHAFPHKVNQKTLRIGDLVHIAQTRKWLS